MSSFIYLCRYCGKKIEDVPKGRIKLYCNSSHKSSYYQVLRGRKFIDKGPEKFIKEQLALPLNPVLMAEKVSYIPKNLTPMVEDFVKLYNIMANGEIRRVRCDNKKEVLSLKRKLMDFTASSNLTFHVKFFSRTIDKINYLYITKVVENGTGQRFESVK